MVPGSTQTGEDQNDDSVGGFVGENAPVLQNEKSRQEDQHTTPDQPNV